MLNVRKKFITVDSSTALVCANLGQSGCSCNCSSCQGCTDCTSCPNLTTADIQMKVYRAGSGYTCGGAVPAPTVYYPNCSAPYAPCPTPYSPNVGPTPTYFVLYPAYTLTGIVVCFFIDTLLTSACAGQYIGDIFVKGNTCGSIVMNVGDSCNVFDAFAVSTGGGINNDLQPS
jgi:hypothetical protein